MNEIDILSQSDKTSDLPSLLREKLDITGDLDFISPQISPTSRKSIAELMGVNFSNEYMNDEDVENTKNMLLLKLKNMELNDLDAIIEEKSEDIDMTELDKTDCSFLLRKNDSLGSDFVKNRFYSECINEDDPILHRGRTKSSVAYGKTPLPEYMDPNQLLVDDSIKKFQSFERNQKIDKFSAFDDMSIQSRSIVKRIALEKDLDRTKDVESPVKVENEDRMYAAQIEGSKRRRNLQRLLRSKKNQRISN